MTDKKKVCYDFKNWILFNLIIPCLIPWGFLMFAYLMQGQFSNHFISSFPDLFNKGFFTFIGLTLFFSINSDMKSWKHLPIGYTYLIIICQLATFYSFSCSLDQSYDDLYLKLNIFNVDWVFHVVVLVFTIGVAVFSKIALLKLKHTIRKKNPFLEGYND
jgi:hypothetical protein